MHVTGWCERCHRVRPIHATGTALFYRTMNKPVFGLCDDCYDAELAESKGRHPAYRHRTDGN